MIDYQLLKKDSAPCSWWDTIKNFNSKWHCCFWTRKITQLYIL